MACIPAPVPFVATSRASAVSEEVLATTILERDRHFAGRDAVGTGLGLVACERPRFQLREGTLSGRRASRQSAQEGCLSRAVLRHFCGLNGERTGR